MTRLGVYAAVSTALAGGVVVSAFHQRANFYSACVYLSQSNLCLMILINLILFLYGSLMYGLQRICYGPLRPIEIEQLYEKAWFAITETCLAMTIFREEVGAWFLVMFVALLTGKVWGWIGDGRVEVLEQQPPTNPRLFHIRLSVSLAMSVIYDLWLMSYTINTVIQQARPNMMVMFLFEFAVLTASSCATACRYGISLIEARVVKQQTQERLSERRREVREQRAEMIREREAAAATAQVEGGTPDADQDLPPLPSEDDVDEMDIEVPGWEAKGQCVLSLDLVTDFVKLLIYITFFIILLVFYGLPIHIMRDLFMTGRSFTKRLSAFLKYRRATQDMNTKYEDATAEDIQREDTCIICREEMRPWSVTNPPEPPVAPGNPPRARPTTTINERSRPKKLPCGHILHLGCLKSWLERQQACPTCRRPVVDPPAPARAAAPNNGNAPGQAGGAAPPGQQNGLEDPPAAPRAGAGMRMLNLGPLRLGFGQANIQDIAQGLGAPQQPVEGNVAAPAPRVYGLEFGFPRRQQQQPQGNGPVNSARANTWQEQIQLIEQGIVAEIRSLQVTQQELQLVQLLQTELARLRLMQTGATDPLVSNFQMPQVPQLGVPLITRNPSPLHTAVAQVQRHGVQPNTAAIPAGSAELPPGVTIPEGWTLLPLQRLDESTSDIDVPPSGIVSSAGPSTSSGAPAPTATTTTTQAQTAISPTIGPSNNNTLAPTAVQKPENNSQASSVDSSDTHAIHTPLSNTADQPDPSIPDTTLQVPVFSSNPPEVPNSNSSMLNPLATLPNWGPSQLFSGPGHSSRTNNQINTDSDTGRTSRGEEMASTSPPRSDTNISDVNQEQSSANLVDFAESASAGERKRADAKDPKQDQKGKAKAVSVEDAEDEAEGT